MSSALVRQALEFVDPDETSCKRKKRGGVRQQSSPGQGSRQQPQPKNINLKQKNKKKDKQIANIVVSKLLKLSKPTIDKETAKKIAKRAAAGKPVPEKVKTKTEQQKSILFPEDEYKTFEREAFCS